MKAPVIVTGPPGSGKTTASAIIADWLGYRVVNVGDVLLDELHRYGVHIERRMEIGGLFLEFAGMDQYLSVVEHIGQDATVVDGIRFASAVKRLRFIHPELIHVHRLGRPAAHRASEGDLDCSARDVELLRELADIRIGWVRNRGELERRLDWHLSAAGLHHR
jgi:dephospho-CoA kinase